MNRNWKLRNTSFPRGQKGLGNKIEVKVGNFHSLIDPWPMASGDFGFFFAFFVAWHADDDESSFFQMKCCCISPSL
ncbi:hypothetical protein OIU85_012933 [Salix viminalis]|uniref:Uncharacterized protein n=1 Tax=Salix viminalis TaxID=40686 RepID=A0A9Q0NQD5_SALVM|nr:hypothetical protein OIU85_012933 [Salix viminalis]